MLGRALVVVIMLAACASEPAATTAADFLADLGAVCVGTTTTLDALPHPPDQITVADFATSAASTLGNEAEQMRRLDPPADLAGDHRAMVRNTDEQSATWRKVAAADADLDGLTTRIGELVRGRNDLADDMGAAQCRRGEV